MAYTTITAPIDGVIISRSVDAGQTVAASLQAPELFVIANDLTKMELHAAVAEADVGQLVDGTKVDTQRLRISTVVGTKGTTTYGTYDNDFWVTEEGVVVRRTLDANVSAKTPAGQVGFKESYDLFLQELPA